MEQEIVYRGVRTLISTERDGRRRWSIHPDGGPPEGVACGLSRAENARGSFKEAVFAARTAVDQWLDEGLCPSPAGA